jgi:hypothetical protein
MEAHIVFRNNVMGLTEGLLFVVVWEPRTGRGGGHQLALELGKAEYLSRVISRSQPNVEVRVLPAADHAAAAVVERQQRQGRRQGAHVTPETCGRSSISQRARSSSRIRAATDS